MFQSTEEKRKGHKKAHCINQLISVISKAFSLLLLKAGKVDFIYLDFSQAFVTMLGEKSIDRQQ